MGHQAPRVQPLRTHLDLARLAYLRGDFDLDGLERRIDDLLASGLADQPFQPPPPPPPPYRPDLDLFNRGGMVRRSS
jgi:hypothetical protein